MRSDQVIINPIVTEKTNLLREKKKKKYAFKVHSAANKNQIMHAVKELFGVSPEACNIVNVKSKPRTVRSRSGYKTGKTTAWKKAIITMRAGDSIDIFEGV